MLWNPWSPRETMLTDTGKKMRTEVACGKVWAEMDGEGQEEISPGDGNVLYVDKGLGFIGVCIAQNS